MSSQLLCGGSGSAILERVLEVFCIHPLRLKEIGHLEDPSTVVWRGGEAKGFGPGDVMTCWLVLSAGPWAFPSELWMKSASGIVWIEHTVRLRHYLGTVQSM